MKNNVITQLAALRTMQAPELKEKWRELYDSEPPPFNRVYLESRLAYRIQELAYGGLNSDTIKRINAMKDGADKYQPNSNNENRPPVGAILVREHRGVEHRVKVLHDGFEYQGKIYRSLTAVASHIAGVHWNGPMFFGLRRRKK